MRSAFAMVVLAALGIVTPECVQAQAPHLVIALPSDSAATPVITRGAIALPDSVREKVGYQHWKGGAIGGAAGAVAGLLLGLAARGACDDCTSSDPVVLETSLAGAGLGGAFGFLVGAASPKYRWVPKPLEAPSPSTSD